MLQLRFPSFDIRDAADGEEALQMVERLIPDLIFMDVRLPGLNGIELTRSIKARHPQITCIIFTGYDSEYREAGRKLR